MSNPQPCRIRYCAAIVCDVEPWLCDDHLSELATHFRTDVESWNVGSPDVQTYVATCGDYLKVGFSRDIDKRLRSLARPNNDTTRPTALQGERLTFNVLATFTGHRERQIQRNLKDNGFHINGEWFVNNAAAREIALA